ncbi:RluA family pseudouridine synthase [Maribacter cobaltidurans]|uniref:RNA pseudouridine synthase n=1 Tax=Maribacter cobaltidurans TaxID=1178778 RepID=A0A223V0F9_9FLAO|nr:RluA family pseudouridine synthase [Maribacter cobaltidurans]ASV28772.1 RNA pseudouridine synthase [Maribacter cobaltidurans]GGD74900.1 pseudouridine synthase [Maribacter cobaltidurans]
MAIIETHTVPEKVCISRLQEYGVGIFLNLPTKSSLKKAIRKNLILVDGKIATTATYILGGETISLREAPIKESKKKLQLPLEIVFEDDHLAVVAKPPGILVSGNGFRTIANALPQNLKRSKEPDAIIPKPVHRLDYPTTGLLLTGKTASSMVTLGNQFKKKQIAKTYYAVTIGAMKNKGIINSPIDGKDSVSYYEVISTVASNRFIFLNLVKLSPMTGRRHQLRKHLQSIGNPILGDPLYTSAHLKLKGKGLYLHAAVLEFDHPRTQERMQIKYALPKKFLKIFEKHPL